MHPIRVIRQPLITEKCTWQGENRNRYSFAVDPKATKPQIRKAIESLYKVRVVKVATQVRKGKMSRNRYGYTRESDWKRATVQLHPDDRIELF
jgi:large subunit ribosomal protein L23